MRAKWASAGTLWDIMGFHGPSMGNHGEIMGSGAIFRLLIGPLGVILGTRGSTSGGSTGAILCSAYVLSALMRLSDEPVLGSKPLRRHQGKIQSLAVKISESNYKAHAASA